MTKSLKETYTRSVEYTDPETYEERSSRDLYWTMHEVRGVAREENYRYASEVPVQVTLYVHESTGIVVADVAAFEEWLRTVVTTS